jgi:nucleoside 2-deoxyribosyltransferase
VHPTSIPIAAAGAPRPRIYLAGPDVFFRDSRQIFDALKAHCDRLGLEGVEPSDGGLSEGFTGSDDALAQSIYEGNVRLIREADGVLANLVCFRGHEPDAGTVFEVGFAIALGKPVVAYGVEDCSYADRVSAAIPCGKDESGLLRETESGAMVEGLGQRLNLMLTRSAAIEASAEAALVRLASLLAVAAR